MATPKWSLGIVTVSKRVKDNLLKHIAAEIDTELRKLYGRNEVFPAQSLVLLYNFRFGRKNEPVGRERWMWTETRTVRLSFQNRVHRRLQRVTLRVGNFKSSKKKYWLNYAHITNCTPKFENYNTGLLYWRTKMFKTVWGIQTGLKGYSREASNWANHGYLTIMSPYVRFLCHDKFSVET